MSEISVSNINVAYWGCLGRMNGSCKVLRTKLVVSRKNGQTRPEELESEINGMEY